MDRPGTARLRVAADIGGTFTDVAFIGEDGVVTTRKVPSTPDDYARAVVDGITALIAQWGLQPDDVGEVLHGCTVATNAILEGKGAKTALVTTKGFRDVLELRRIRMPRLYEPLYVKPKPLAPRQRRFEVAERLAADGRVVVPLDRDDVMAAVRGIRESGAEAVAVAFLNAYADGRHERIVGDILRRELPDCFISLSVDVLPEIREYERTSTTVINAYLGPPVKAYVDSLVNRLDEAGLKGRLLIMQSSGGMLDAATVMDKPVQIVECGPAAGVIGSLHLGRLIGRENLITLDMGGTTAKASLIENDRLLRTDEYEVGGGISLSSRLVKGGGYALKTPVIDISEVGAGGGSIVWFDRVGQLKVGPQSAGAVPGPACYRSGGEEPTVTDANVVLGLPQPDGDRRRVGRDPRRRRASRHRGQDRPAAGPRRAGDRPWHPRDRQRQHDAGGQGRLHLPRPRPAGLRSHGFRRQRRHPRRRAGAGAADRPASSCRCRRACSAPSAFCSPTSSSPSRGGSCAPSAISSRTT